MSVTQDSQSGKENLLFREYLATDRTLLAIDRTFLSYIRTALTLFVAGVSFIKFFDTAFIQSLGALMIVSATVTIIIGVKRCVDTTRLIKNFAKKKGYPSLNITSISTSISAPPLVALDEPAEK